MFTSLVFLLEVYRRSWVRLPPSGRRWRGDPKEHGGLCAQCSLCFSLPVSQMWFTGWRSCWGDREELKSLTIVLAGAKQDVQSFMRSHPSLLPPTLRRAPLPHTCVNTNVLKAHSRDLLNYRWLLSVVSCTLQAPCVQSPTFSIPIT